MQNQVVVRNNAQPTPPWLTQIIANNNQAYFPIHYASTKSKQIPFSPSKYPDQQLINPPRLDAQTIGGPVYVLNIPFFASEKLTMTVNAKLITDLVKKIANESFYDPTSNEKSKTIARQRVFVIIGVNRPYSIDSDLNLEFDQWIKDFPKIKTLQTFIVGKFWHPILTYNNINKPLKGQKEIDAQIKITADFRLLKRSDPLKADDVKKYLNEQKFFKTKKGVKIEGKKSRLHTQTPYQQIRNWVIQETFAQLWLQELFRNKIPPLVYLGFMDGDTHSLCGTEPGDTGLFKNYDVMVSSKNVAPMMMSTGYFLPRDTDNISHLANLIDMVERQAIAKFFPLGVYFPEPNLFLLLNELWNNNRQNMISFLGINDGGNDTESRRLIENLIPYWDTTRIDFVAKRCLVTTPPERLKATPIMATSVLTQRAGDFSLGFDVKDLSENLFKSLKGVSQTHFKQKIWATNMHIGLKAFKAIPAHITATVQIRGALLNICTVFDFPTFFNELGYEYVLSRGGNVYLGAYKDYIRMLATNCSKIVKKIPALILPINGVSFDYIKKKIATLRDNLEKLTTYQIAEVYQELILKAAAASGQAVYDTLAWNVRGFG